MEQNFIRECSFSVVPCSFQCCITSEFRVEFLNPPFMTTARPKLLTVPKQITFNQKFTVDVDIPANLKASSIQGKLLVPSPWSPLLLANLVALMDLGFSSHAFHASNRLVFMEAQLSRNRKSLTITSPPNNRIYPPGPGMLIRGGLN